MGASMGATSYSTDIRTRLNDGTAANWAPVGHTFNGMDSADMGNIKGCLSPMKQQDAPISTRTLVMALIAISLGTVIEWYDYSIYSQLSKVLGKVFFPSGNPAVQAVSFWGLFAVGFLSRPVGAIMFGHLGDTKGRGTCLLVTVLLMGIPTILIGCLPSYHQIGIAAPVIMAVLRLLQGLAMGGEFGAAMVYLVEIADPRYKALTGSIGYISLGAGVITGILTVALVNMAVPEEAMLAWGWRIPFLLSVLTVLSAAILRYNMPESSEFSKSRDEIDEEVQKRRQQQHQTHGLKQHLATVVDSDSASTDGHIAIKDVEVSGADIGLAGEKAKKQHYVPVKELFRGHWAAVLMHAFYGTWISASFLIGYSWLPSFFVANTKIPTGITLWMVLSCMFLFTLMVPVAGYLADKGLPRLTITIGLCLVSSASAIPMFLAFQTKSLALSWALQAMLLAMSGYSMGMLPAVVAAIYPAGVRISGCNLGINLSSTFGGICPLLITAIQAATGDTFIVPGAVLAVAGIMSTVSCILLIRYYPQANKIQ